MSHTRIAITPKAKEVIDRLKEKHGDLMFHQSGGCCDGSSPMCYEKGEFIVGPSDVWIGELEGCDFFMSKNQFEYWKHTHLTLDITEGRGASFSIEIPLGLRFMVRSRLFTEAEEQSLEPVRSGAEFE
ncbi:DUF779 domain-containing protein [Flammeovirgaceae bacterium SG7u.111]|nr:DUF779 domain-containing protein [Flammeovirgaceae bacterium SG7u.132]WPO37973.1 DUF779 domain-containing protein [Flammeovirgaceae bacterium SG7u.111]